MILMAAGVVTGDIWQPVNHTTITGERGICGGGGQRPPAPHTFSQLLPLNYHHSDLGVYRSSTPSRPFEPVTGYFSPQHSLIPRRRHIASRPTATTLKVTSAWQTPLAVIMPLNQHKQGFFFLPTPPPPTQRSCLIDPGWNVVWNLCFSFTCMNYSTLTWTQRGYGRPYVTHLFLFKLIIPANSPWLNNSSCEYDACAHKVSGHWFRTVADTCVKIDAWIICAFFFWAPSVFAELLNQLEQHKQSLIEDVDE